MKTHDNAASTLAALGLAVFPVRQGRKEPAIRDWQTRATTDPGEAFRLFGGGQAFNIGVATGKRSGVFVLDIDRKAVDGLATLADLESEHGMLPATWEVRTPSGGSHLWFEYPTGTHIGNRASFAPALDIRGEGGFVVAPPSVVEDRAYRWLRRPDDQPLAKAPQWLIDQIAPPPRPPPSSPSRRPQIAGRGRMARYVTTAFVREIQTVESAPEGRRNQLLFQAAANLGEFVGAGFLRAEMVQAALEAAAEACGLTHDDGRHAVLATIASGLKRGIEHPREVST